MTSNSTMKHSRKKNYVTTADEFEDVEDHNSIARQSPRGSESFGTLCEEKDNETLNAYGNVSSGIARREQEEKAKREAATSGNTYNIDFHIEQPTSLHKPLPSSQNFSAPITINRPNHIVKEVHTERVVQGPTKIIERVVEGPTKIVHAQPVQHVQFAPVPVKEYVPVSVGGLADSDSDSSSSDDEPRRRHRRAHRSPMAQLSEPVPRLSNFDIGSGGHDFDLERLIDQASSMANNNMFQQYEMDSIVSMSDKMMSNKLSELREKNRAASMKVAQMEAGERKRDALLGDIADMKERQRELETQLGERVKEIIQLQHDNSKLQNKISDVEEEKEDELFALKKKHRTEADNLRLQLEMKDEDIDEARLQQEALQKHLNKLLGKGGRPGELGGKAKLINDRVRDLQGELQKAEMRVEELRDQLDKQDRESTQIVAEREMIIEKQQRQIEAQKANIGTLASKAQKADQGMVNVSGKDYNVFDVLQDNSKLEVEVQSTQKKLKTEQKAVEKLKKDLETAKKALLNQKNMLLKIGTNNTNQDSQIEHLKDMLQKMTAINQALMKENTKLKNEFKKQRSEMMQLHKVSTQNSAELEQVRKTLTESQLREKSIRKDYNESQMQLIEKEGLETQVKTLRQEIRKLKKNLKECRVKIDDAQSREVDATMALDKITKDNELLDDSLVKVNEQLTLMVPSVQTLAGKIHPQRSHSDHVSG